MVDTVELIEKSHVNQDRILRNFSSTFLEVVFKVKDRIIQVVLLKKGIDVVFFSTVKVTVDIN